MKVFIDKDEIVVDFGNEMLGDNTPKSISLKSETSGLMRTYSLDEGYIELAYIGQCQVGYTDPDGNGYASGTYTITLGNIKPIRVRVETVGGAILSLKYADAGPGSYS